MTRRRAGSPEAAESVCAASQGASAHPVTVESAPTRATVLASLSEKAFQASVLRHLRSHGWVCFVVPNMRMTTAGLPDILALHAGRPVLLAWELKRDHGKPTPIQRAVITLLQAVPGVDARVIRPSDWEALRETV